MLWIGGEEVNQTKKILVLLTLLVVLILVYRLPRRDMTGTEALTVLLQTTGAEIVAGEVQFYATLEEEYQTMAELEQIVLTVSDLLGLMEGDVHYSEGETFRVVDVNGQTAFGPSAHIVVQSNPAGSDAGILPQTYLLVVCQDAAIAHIAAIIERLDDVLQSLAPNGQLSYYLTAELPGRKSNEEMEKMAKAALAAVRGKIVEGMQDEDFISYTAFTPLLTQHLDVDGERFNLNFAIRYDDYHDKTILWAGFPLIHASY